MAEIDVTRSGPDEFRVEVTEGGTSTLHQVTVTGGDLDAFGGGTPETLVEESFRFLLEREPKESILRRFELPVIARYFPEYPEEIRRRLGAE
ncbi:MAG: hypothetical protein ACE5KX_08160 [Acidimicrobiia bacterium]